MEKDLAIIQGDTFYLSIAKYDEEDTQIDFEEGETFIFSAKKNLKQRDYDIQSNKFTLVDGEIIIELSHSDTNIDLGNYYYDIQYTDLNGDIFTLVKGNLEITWEVTK